MGNPTILSRGSFYGSLGKPTWLKIVSLEVSREWGNDQELTFSHHPIAHFPTFSTINAGSLQSICHILYHFMVISQGK
jgi:hypothetical protein